VEGDETIETYIQLKLQHNFYFTPNQTHKWLSNWNRKKST